MWGRLLHCYLIKIYKQIYQLMKRSCYIVFLNQHFFIFRLSPLLVSSNWCQSGQHLFYVCKNWTNKLFISSTHICLLLIFTLQMSQFMHFEITYHQTFRIATTPSILNILIQLFYTHTGLFLKYVLRTELSADKVSSCSKTGIIAFTGYPISCTWAW